MSGWKLVKKSESGNTLVEERRTSFDSVMGVETLEVRVWGFTSDGGWDGVTLPTRMVPTGTPWDSAA